ncbi:MAG: glycosyltransferase family 4 protein [Candidatus Omnitrophica bacterium]|nr:glycosyltransferase family 4 protein [Candidatus Omnitrophota bacterium]
MKILRIIARLNIGGPARNAVLLTDALSQSRPGLNLAYNCSSEDSNYETVLVCGEVGSGEGDMMWLAKEKGIEPMVVPELGRELSFINDWRAFWKIYGIICRERPDIVHTHTAKAGTLGRMAGILYRIMDSRLPSGKAAGFRGNDKACGNDREVILIHTFHGHVFHGYFGKVKTWFFVWIEKILSLFTDRIITVSESLKKELVERFRIAPENKFFVIELGFELGGLLKLPIRENSDCVNIGIVGRLVPVKNHRMLLRSVKKLIAHSSWLIGKVKFVIIGDGELRQELENYARGLGIEEIVEFRGWVKDVSEIYRDLDIVVLTSLNEGTPVSIIEAMAAGRPVIATNVGGVADIVEDGKSGYLVESDNEEVFSEKLLDLINNPTKRRMFGEYGRGLVKDRFSKDRLIKDTEGLYNNILDGFPPA